MANPYENITLRPESDEEFEFRVSHRGRITLPAFQMAISILFALAMVCFVARLCIRLHTRRRLFLDDCILIVAVGALIGFTIGIYHDLLFIYVTNTILHSPETVMTTAILKWLEDLGGRIRRKSTYLILFQWTPIYGAKFCFFAFFHPLLRSSHKVRIYYWACLGFTIAAFAASIAEYPIRTKLLGNVSAQHVANRDDLASASQEAKLMIAITILDVIGDLMIISFPLLLLRKSRMKLSIKFGIASFLSLSIFMIICSICRAAGITAGQKLDTAWGWFWQEAEACVAVIMASITVFRTLLVPKHNSRNAQLVNQWLATIRSSKRSRGLNSKSQHQAVEDPEIPARLPVAFTGIRSLVRRDHGGPGNIATAASSNFGSGFDPLEADYHAAIRGGNCG